MLGGELEGVRVKTKCFLTKLFLHCSEILPQAIFPDNVKFVSRAAMCFIYLQLCAMALILIPVLNVFFLFGTCPYSWRFIYTHYNINNIFHYLRKKLFLQVLYLPLPITSSKAKQLECFSHRNKLWNTERALRAHLGNINSSMTMTIDH